MIYLLILILLAGCNNKLVSIAPPLPPVVTKCQWNIHTGYFEGDRACEKFIRDYVSTQIGQ